MKRIFSGIQPSGNLHIGNYLGAIKNWVALQDKYESIFCVVDLHAITVPQDPEELRKKTLEVVKIYLASGIDPEKSTIFVQSHLPEHAELMWILNTIVKIPELEKMTQYKDKTTNSSSKSISAGLLNYPILMAADILLYDTDLVPVGEDQVQHVEITRTIAKRFNNRFGETFKLPEPFITQEGMPARNAAHSAAGGRIMGLDDPTKKMSKSAESIYNFIAFSDSPESIQKKIAKAVTDSGSEIVYSDEKPAIKNLINIYSLLSDKSTAEIEKMYKNKNYAEFKKDLAEVMVNFLTPFQKRLANLDDKHVKDILEKGAERAKKIAQSKITEVKEKVGLI